MTQPFTEGQILTALGQRFDWYKNMVIPRCCGLGGFERDLVMVTPAGYLTEVEVKLSLSDWKKDAEKSVTVYSAGYVSKSQVSKFQDVELGGRHKWFMYCVPLALWEIAQTKLTAEHLPPWAGVLTVEPAPFNSKRLQIKTARAATELKCRKLTDGELEGLRGTFYYRFWRHCSRAPETMDKVVSA